MSNTSTGNTNTNTNIFNLVKIDEKDGRFSKLRQDFLDELKKRFSCEDYDAIVE
jgi:hypothetical protein